MRARFLFPGLTALVLLGAAAAPASAATEEWEQLILDGMRRQDVRAREVSLDRLVEDAVFLEGRTSFGAEKVTRLYLLGRAYGKRLDPKRRDLENARDAYREVLKLAPSCWFAWRDLGVLAFRAQPPDLREAEASFQKALSFNPSYVQVLRDLAKLCLESTPPRPADAAVHLRRVIALEPSDVPARVYLVMALVQLQKHPEARRELEILRKGREQNPVFRDLEARIEMAAGRIRDAIAIWTVLMHENPSSPEPLRGLWGAYAELLRRGEHVAKEDVKQVVKRLSFIERDEEMKQKLRHIYASLDAPTPTYDPNKPPDDAQLLQVMGLPDPSAREKALSYVARRPERPSDALLKAVLGHLGPQKEPVPAVREAAIEVLERHGGVGTLPIVRLLLRDPDPGVRLSALVALVTIGQQTPEAGRAALLMLARFADDADGRLAADARGAVLTLAGAWLEPAADASTDTEADRRARWQAWWRGVVGVEARIRALADYDVVKDRLADDVLAPYLDDPDLHVVHAAYDALVEAAAYVPDPARRAWLQGIPRIQPQEFTAEKQATIVKSLKDWLATRPR